MTRNAKNSLWNAMSETKRRSVFCEGELWRYRICAQVARDTLGDLGVDGRMMMIKLN